MDVSADTAAKLAQLKGLIQIEAACRTPLSSIKVHAKAGCAFRALATGLKPLHPITHQLQMFAVARELGIATR